MKRYNLVLVLFLILFFSISTYAQDIPGVLNLNVEGNATIKQNDVARAREKAIQNALENAILEATAKLLSVSVKDEKIQRVKSIIIDDSIKYINNYKITAEKKQLQTFVVNVNVVVAAVALKNDLLKMGFLQAPQTEKSNLIVYLNVKGLKKYSDLRRLREFLQSRTKIVKNIYPCQFEWQQASFEIEIFGDVQSFADELAKNTKYLLDTTQIDKNQIEITCRQKGDGK